MSRLEQLLSFLQASPTDSFILFAVAKEYEKMGDKDQALAYYLQLHTSDPDYVGLYFHLGRLYEQLEAPKKAWDAYSEGMEVAKKLGDEHSLSELAGARMVLGDEEDFV